MTKNKPLIFITNDDGYNAKGINALVEALEPIGEIVVVAPDVARSGMSSAITSTLPIRYKLVQKRENVSVYSCTGTPVDCVKLGLSEIMDRKPDLIVTGINHGSNAAISVMYSGTMGAAFEGCIFKVPSIGFSLDDHDLDADFGPSKEVVKTISLTVLDSGLPAGICLNVNIPKGSDIKGTRICHQTKGQWIKEFAHSTDGVGSKVFWLTGYFENDEPDNTHTDEWALANGYVSVVPTKIDMTAYDFIDKIKEWEKEFNIE